MPAMKLEKVGYIPCCMEHWLVRGLPFAAFKCIKLQKTYCGKWHTTTNIANTIYYTMDKISENTTKLLNFVSEKYEKGELDNSSLVQLIERSGEYLNLQTIPNYAKEKGKTYNGVKKYRKIVKLFGVKFVIENE